MTNQIALKLRNTLTGILPPLSMPFDEDGNLAKGALKAQVDHIRVGANGAALWWRGTPDARSGNVLSFVVDTVF